MSESDDIDMLAAEYVLGTLDAAEREDVAARLSRESGLARAVDDWHSRLAPLSAIVVGIVPPVAVYDGLMARLFGSSVVAFRPAETVPVRQLRRWQAATGGFALMAASLIGWVTWREKLQPVPAPRFTAVLQRDAGSPAMVVDVDLAALRLTVRPVGTSSPAGHSYELWIIDPAIGRPRSLGIVPERAVTEASLRGFDRAVIADATYAITVEAAGGSPTGAPTTSPILSGKLVASRS